MIELLPAVQKLSETQNLINFSAIDISGEISDYSKNELIEFVEKHTKYKLNDAGFEIKFEKICDKIECEWYKIQVNNNQMLVNFCEQTGAYRAVQTVKQLLSQDLYECAIEDWAENHFRSFMIDVGRYFYPVQDLKKIIDLISLFKFNYLHLHLTEDQGWRFESKKYPKLTEIGSRRSHTNFNAKPESGFYTQDELRDIVQYCHNKFIKVIPEIDIPGHTVSALACYPELSCFDRNLKVATHWGIKFDIMCAGKEFTYRFCHDLIDELCEIFTDDYIHIGGDEVPKKRWELCKNCNAKMKQVGADNMEELQIYFANEMAEYAMQKGKQVIMWNINQPEDSKIKLNKNIILQFWGQKTDENFQNVIKQGRRTISSNSSAYYIDLPYGRISLEDSYNIQGITGLDNTKLLYGYEACLWTEYVKDLKKAKFNTFPRLLAISEVVWGGESNKNYQDFMHRLEHFGRGYLAKFDVNMPKSNVYNPSKVRAFFSQLWFEKRQLTWQGLTLNIDNLLLKRKIIRKNRNNNC